MKIYTPNCHCSSLIILLVCSSLQQQAENYHPLSLLLSFLVKWLDYMFGTRIQLTTFQANEKKKFKLTAVFIVASVYPLGNSTVFPLPLSSLGLPGKTYIDLACSRMSLQTSLMFASDTLS